MPASSIVCAYGMAETVLGVSFAMDTGLEVDEVHIVVADLATTSPRRSGVR